MRVQGAGCTVQAPRLSRRRFRIISTQYLVLGTMLAAVAAFQDAVRAQTPASSGGPLEVVMAGKPVKKTLALVTTQPARIEALEQSPIHSKIAD